MPRVPLMIPKFGLMIDASGFPQFGWLGALKASNRNWMF